MSDRDRLHALMLEHLYGLLDADEVRELEAHLATAEGAEVRARGEQWRARLAGAAKVPFPAAAFTPPGEAPAPGPAARPAAPAPVSMRAVWTRWALAASVLLVFGGLGGPAAYQFVGWYAQSRQTRDVKLALDDRRGELSRVEQQHQARRDEWRKDRAQAAAQKEEVETAYRDALAQAHKAVGQKDLLVRLTGPERVQPGAANEWKIETVTTDGRAASPRQIEVVVRDQKDMELLRETHAAAAGGPTLRLSPDFWAKVKPGSDLYLEVIAHAADNRRSVLAERIPLARPVFVTHLVTDKPLYRPGETVRYRSLTLDRATFLPPDRDLHLKFALKNPDGALIPLNEGNGRAIRGLEPVMGPDGKPLRGIGTGEYEVPDDALPGEYALELYKVGANQQETLLDSRRFRVNRYAVEKFEKKLEFAGKSYGPGDLVEARIEVTPPPARPLRDPRADLVATAGEDRTIHAEKNVRCEIIPDTAGKQPKRAVCTVRFRLPADLFANRQPADAPLTPTLSVTIRDGNEAETIQKAIPLVEKDLTVAFFPEGGDLVAGVPGRVYFEVRTLAGRRADLKGAITDGKETVAQVATLTDPEHPGVKRGQGVFALTPKAGTRYFLKVQSPTGITEPTKDGFPLPEVKPDGVVLTALDAATEKGAPIRVRVQAAKGPKTLHVGAYARGRLIAHQRVEAMAGVPVEVSLQGDESVGGVTRVTVFEEPTAKGERRINLIPRAERLVYRKPGEHLALTISPDKDRYSPAGKVGLELGAADEQGRPAPAILMVAVVNQSVLAMGDDKTERLLPTHFLLGGEVKHPAELEHADFLLTDHPKAAVALDLLLGTQGWRRFAEQGVLPQDPAERDEVERMLVAHGQQGSAAFELSRLERQRLAAEFLPKLEQAELRVLDVETAWTEYQKTVEPLNRTQVANARSRTEAAEKNHEKAAHDLYEFETRLDTLRGWGLPLFLVGLLVLAGLGMAFAAARRRAERRPFLRTAGAAFATAILVGGAVLLTRATPDAERGHVAVLNWHSVKHIRTVVTGTTARPLVAKQVTDLKHDRGTGAQVKPVRGTLPPDKFPSIGVPASLAHKAARPANPAAAKSRRDPEGERLTQLLEERGHRQAAARKGSRTGPTGPAVEAELVPSTVPFVVREYAHQRDPSLGNVRSDFTETVYWHPVLVLPGTGRTKVDFQLSDDVARYRILVAGHTVDGRIGAVVKTIEATEP